MPTTPPAHPLIGAHVDSADPLTAATACGAEVIQFFLTDPQSYAEPKPHPHRSHRLS